jgi:glucokinase
LALAEGTFGAARDDDSYLSMVVSTGIGGGLVMDGRLLDGRPATRATSDTPTSCPTVDLCGCGSYGCLEAEASGSAIEAVTGRPPSEADDATRARTSELVGRAVGMLASVLDFDRCYIAGSVALGSVTSSFRRQHVARIDGAHGLLRADLEICAARNWAATVRFSARRSWAGGSVTS